MEEDTTSSKGVSSGLSEREIIKLSCRLITPHICPFHSGLVNTPKLIAEYLCSENVWGWSMACFCSRWTRFISLSSDIRNYWTLTRPPTTSSVVQCGGSLSAWTSSASHSSLPLHFSLSSCTTRYLPPMQAWPYHMQCRFVNKFVIWALKEGVLKG